MPVVSISSDWRSDMKVILPVCEVPLGAIVTKVTGTVKYNLSKTLKIYQQGKTEPTVIDCADGAFFMIPLSHGTASITAIPSQMNVAWNVDDEDLYRYLADKLEEDK